MKVSLKDETVLDLDIVKRSAQSRQRFEKLKGETPDPAVRMCLELVDVVESMLSMAVIEPEYKANSARKTQEIERLAWVRGWKAAMHNVRESGGYVPDEVPVRS